MFLLYTVLQLPAEQHLTRALVVTQELDPTSPRFGRDMSWLFRGAIVVGVAFVAVTLDRFFEGDLQ